MGGDPGPNGTGVVIRRRIESDDLIPGLNAIAVKSGDRIIVLVSEAIPGRLQRASARSALRAAGGSGWTRNRVPSVLPLFTGISLWRTALASRARRFAAAGSVALILTVIIGAVLAGPGHSPPVRAIITPVAPSSTPHVRGGTSRAVHTPGHAKTSGPGRPGTVAHRQPRGAPGRRARPSPTETTPTGPSPSPDLSSSPAPSPSPSPSKTRHCLIPPLIC